MENSQSVQELMVKSPVTTVEELEKQRVFLKWAHGNLKRDQWMNQMLILIKKLRKLLLPELLKRDQNKIHAPELWMTDPATTAERQESNHKVTEHLRNLLWLKESSGPLRIQISHPREYQLLSQ